MIVYHTTFKSRLAKIRREGLLPGRRRNWSSKMFGTRLGSTSHVYVWSSWDSAMRWTHKMEWHLGRPALVLCIDGTGLDLLTDPLGDPVYRGALMTARPIDPERILAVRTLDKEVMATLVGSHCIDKHGPTLESLLAERAAA